MKTYYFFDLATGLFTSEAFTGPAEYLQPRPGLGTRDDVSDWYSQRVDLDTGELVDYQPPQPSDEHEWNAITRRWVLTAEATARRDARAAAIARVRQLEDSQPRTIREAALGDPDARRRLQAIEDEIAELRPLLRGGP